jgi:predicted glutamine amidotransferase
MCRLAAFPPGFSRVDALSILQEMEGMNRDGVGSVHVNQEGKFEGHRYPGSLTSLLVSKQGEQFLSHMPHNGWTIAHLRMSTHGGVAKENTHPFTAGEWCVAHNGCWSDSDTARLLLEKAVRFAGETDSEVAAHVLNVVGPKRFAFRIYGGVFLALNRTGHLWVLKTSGLLERFTCKGKTLLATDLPADLVKIKKVNDGWYRYGPSGKLLDKDEVTPAPDDDEDSWLKAHYVYEKYPRQYAGPGEDEPAQGLIDPTETREPNDVPEEAGWYFDKGRWHKQADVVGPDGFPVKVHCTGTKPITVPRDAEVSLFDQRGYPRYPAVPRIAQTAVPRLYQI